MNSGRYALSQVLEYIHWQTLKRLSARYGTETRVRHFGCRLQLIITPMNSMASTPFNESENADQMDSPHALYCSGFAD
jgi:hypothetical protein